MGVGFPEFLTNVNNFVNNPVVSTAQFLGFGVADQNKRDDQQRVNDEKAKWDTDRAIVNTEWQGLLGEYGSDQFADRVITVQDPFETMSHQEIYDAVKDVDPAAINTKADGWRKLTQDARDAIEAFSKGVEEDITNYWNGQSGTAAIEGTRAFATSFTTIAACFQMIAHGLDLMEGHLAQAKNSVGKPDDTTVGDKVINALPFQSVIKGPEYRATEAQENARFVMTTYYRPGAEDVDGHTPNLPQPKNPVDDKDEGWKPPVNPPGNPVWPPSEPGGKEPGEEIENGGGDDNTGNGDESNPTDDTTDDTTPQSTTPASTTPASTTPAGTQLPTSDLPRGTSGVPGGVGTGGLGSGGGLGGSGVPSTPGMGRSLPGGGAGMQGKAAASTGAGAGSGRNGRMGMPGMGMPAGRGGGKGEDDDEHKTPDYLIYDHGDELLGSQPPALPPGGVIGG
ncbi:hypothetical protein [Nocardia cyriacigeorgica]|uniref:hypothetical protein n=1 Tax=Nocardia cyriacigeorgica TaxID=135487 RepID=UPI000CE9BCFD|nr:hypothetical protein [Nocardia cyriacigeorgica]AVH20423.1 hypothetical protein C5B73_01965 [Nocardia cyriacigeorgica]MBF6325984.1 hypothetical protein [Nocardia cyriacigeorgica]MBF6499508.1 hypothetical protein [Nocardia cyriacigeorgica]PPJ02176.1 hypothetical protein C5E43_27260 [Nocardia cyriacigeorgica]